MANSIYDCFLKDIILPCLYMFTKYFFFLYFTRKENRKSIVVLSMFYFKLKKKEGRNTFSKFRKIKFLFPKFFSRIYNFFRYGNSLQ